MYSITRFGRAVTEADNVWYGFTVTPCVPRTEVIDERESRSRPTQGIVTFTHRAFNQRNVLVGQCKGSALILRKPAP